jgi:hypothetical protein
VNARNKPITGAPNQARRLISLAIAGDLYDQLHAVARSERRKAEEILLEFVREYTRRHHPYGWWKEKPDSGTKRKPAARAGKRVSDKRRFRRRMPTVRRSNRNAMGTIKQ